MIYLPCFEILWSFQANVMSLYRLVQINGTVECITKAFAAIGKKIELVSKIGTSVPNENASLKLGMLIYT